MGRITNFSEAHTALRRFYAYARTDYDLSVMRRLMDFLGNPQDGLRVVHIAGTSGKTSTAYYAAALLRSSGAKVGLTVSPHVDEVNERVQVDLQPLPEREFCTELTEFLELVEKSGLRPSYFEVLVAFAYWEFAKQKVDYAVVEVGLGGLLDGTNVVSRRDKVCIITDIGLDHTEVLGDTLEKVAAQKAGIIQAGNHVFMYGQSPEILNAVKGQCQEKPAELHVLPTSAQVSRAGLPLFQRRNLGLAVQAVNFVLQRDDKRTVNNEEIAEAATLRIPARMERFEVGGKTVIVDGSHNAQKLGTLVESVKEAYPGETIAALVAFVEAPDERWQGGLTALLPILNKLIITSFSAEQDLPKQSVEPRKLQDFCKKRGFDQALAIDEPSAALAELMGSAEPLLLVAGSFYLLNSIRPLIKNF